MVLGNVPAFTSPWETNIGTNHHLVICMSRAKQQPEWKLNHHRFTQLMMKLTIQELGFCWISFLQSISDGPPSGPVGANRSLSQYDFPHLQLEGIPFSPLDCCLMVTLLPHHCRHGPITTLRGFHVWLALELDSHSSMLELGTVNTSRASICSRVLN